MVVSVRPNLWGIRAARICQAGATVKVNRSIALAPYVMVDLTWVRVSRLRWCHCIVNDAVSKYFLLWDAEHQRKGMSTNVMKEAVERKKCSAIVASCVTTLSSYHFRRMEIHWNFTHGDDDGDDTCYFFSSSFEQTEEMKNSGMTRFFSQWKKFIAASFHARRIA